MSMHNIIARFLICSGNLFQRSVSLRSHGLSSPNKVRINYYCVRYNVIHMYNIYVIHIYAIMLHFKFEFLYIALPCDNLHALKWRTSTTNFHRKKARAFTNKKQFNAVRTARGLKTNYNYIIYAPNVEYVKSQ